VVTIGFACNVRGVGCCSFVVVEAEAGSWVARHRMLVVELSLVMESGNVAVLRMRMGRMNSGGRETGIPEIGILAREVAGCLRTGRSLSEEVGGCVGNGVGRVRNRRVGIVRLC